MANRFFRIETQEGAPREVAGSIITPRSQSVRLLFGRNGGIVWNRPVSVRVRTAEGTEQNIPVLDVTRQAEVALLVSALMSSLVLWGLVACLRRLFGKHR